MKTPIATEIEKKQLQFYSLANGLMGIAYFVLLAWGVAEFVQWIM